MTGRRKLWLVLAALATACAAQTADLEDLGRFPRAMLEIKSGAKTSVFDVWIANTGARQEQGLMFVRDLPADRGMLFPQEPPQPMAMWMKNTFIPLDMLFVDSNRRIVKIAHAVPHSLDTIAWQGPVAAVVELKAGTANDLKLKIGANVSWTLRTP